MTLAAPRSRRGRFTLVLAAMVALAALSGILLWATTARAAFPVTTLVVDQTPNTGPIAPGALITYNVTLELVGGDSGGSAWVDLDLDNSLENVQVTYTDGDFELPADCQVLAGNEVRCEAIGGGLGSQFTQGTHEMTVTANAPGSGTVALASVSAGDADETISGTNATGDQPLTVGLSLLVTVDPASATNPPGTSHTITFTLEPNVNCASGDAANPGDDETAVSCATSDVTTGCSAGVAVAVTNSAIGTPTTVTVTLTNNGSDEVCSVVLSLVANSGNQDPDDDVAFTASATKSFTFAFVAGELRHWDLPDAASEDAAGNADGILDEQDDNDDAIGSFHAACIIGSSLTHAADAGDITWNIVPVTAPLPASVTEVAGPNGEPCVRWGSGGTGAHQITAVWDNGVAPAVTYFWDGYCVEGDGCSDADGEDEPVPLPLIKEWNNIDFTCIVARDGNVGDTLAQNTGQLGNWVLRDVVGTTVCGANLDGTTVDVGGVLIQGPVGFGHVDAPGRSFIDYTIGSHSDAGGQYVGPIDGALQRYTVSGDCGSVRLEDPTTGNVIILVPNTVNNSATVLSSDKGVAFQVVPNDEGAIETTPFNANCDPSSSLTVTIETREDNLFRSPPRQVAEVETITVHWVVGPPTSKQPQLAWAGMRVALEHDWSAADGSCPWIGEEGFFVRYAKLTGKGAIVSDLGNGAALGPDFVVVRVGSDCISRVVYESEDNGEEDIVAHVVEPGFGGGWSAISQQVAFVLYYMKFEDVTLGLVPGGRAGHNSNCGSASDPCQNFTPATPPVWNTANDVESLSANVSADVLARVRVRGWLERSNCPVRDSGVDSNGGFLPANRCIFPDDWEFIAGGVLAEEFRPNYDIMKAPDTPFLPNTTGCQTPAQKAAGPFSWLDRALFQLIPSALPASLCGDSKAPHVNGGFRETVFPDGDVDEWDAPMPPALVRLRLTGSGFIQGADKDHIYLANNNPYYVTHIPAEPFITPINEDLTGYQWNTWGTGSKSGPYEFWTSLADHGPEVVSCPGSSPCGAAGVPTGGYKMIKVYTDNHGEAMAFVNGDADLTFADCDNSGPLPEHNIEIVNGWYCEPGDVVGSSTLNAVVDYPDKRKHEPLSSNNVTIEWTWGGIKQVFIEPGQTPQFNYVVFQVKDRDGFCDPSPSLHPVLGERVNFLIDSPNGVIFDAKVFVGGKLPAAQGDQVQTVTFRRTDADICEARVLISESLLGPVNVLVHAFDPEGDVIFDVIVNEPTPTPTPSPTPTPPPPAPSHLWGDLDCDGDVDTVDALAALRFVAGLPVFQTGPCFSLGSNVVVDRGASHRFGDTDCDGDNDVVDALAILRFVAGMSPLPQREPCPDIGAGVNIS